MSRQDPAIVLENVADLLDHGMSAALIPSQIGRSAAAISKLARGRRPDIAATFDTLRSQDYARRQAQRSGINLMDVRDRDLLNGRHKR